MSKKVKSLLLVLCAIVFFAAGIFATLAWLNDTTDEAVNTITIGDVHITMDEAVVDEYGEMVYKTNPDNPNEVLTDENGVPVPVDRIPNAESDKTGNAYTLIPGEDYIKDPTVHVAANSEPAYVFVRVLNPIAPVEADGEGDDTIAEQMAVNGWVPVVVEGANYANLYVYKLASDTDNVTEATIVSTKNDVDAKDLPIFASFVVDSSLDNDKEVGTTGKTFDEFENEKIQIRAFAIQAKNVDFKTAASEANAALQMTDFSQGE